MPADFILVTSSDVLANAEDDFNLWYKERHLPELVACPGFQAASRYEATNGEPKFLAIYDMDSAEAVTTPEAREVWGWGPMAPHVRNFHGRIYRRTATVDGS